MPLAAQFPVLFAAFYRIPFVVQFFSSSQSNLQFDQISVIEKYSQGYHRVSFLFHFGPQPGDLPLLE
jgi:hypothetical protein